MNDKKIGFSIGGLDRAANEALSCSGQFKSVCPDWG